MMSVNGFCIIEREVDIDYGHKWIAYHYMLSLRIWQNRHSFLVCFRWQIYGCEEVLEAFGIKCVFMNSSEDYNRPGAGVRDSLNGWIKYVQFFTDSH
jgi:hypothetical protein